MDVVAQSPLTPVPVTYCLFYTDKYFPCMPSDDWAAWAQAFFSVLAIVVSVTIALYTLRHQHAHERSGDIAAARVFAAGWAVTIGFGELSALHIKDSCTRSIQRDVPLLVSTVKESLQNIVLPDEAQVLRFSKASLKGSVAMANASLYHSMISRSFPTDGIREYCDPLSTRLWSKLLQKNLTVVKQELTLLMIDPSSRLRWWKKVYFKIYPAARIAAFEKHGLETGWFDSIPLEPLKPTERKTS